MCPILGLDTPRYMGGVDIVCPILGLDTPRYLGGVDIVCPILGRHPTVYGRS